MFFRATIRRLFPVACAAVMLCASAVAHVPRAPVPRIPLQVAQPALVRNNIFLAPSNAVVLVQTNGAAAIAGNNLHWPPNAVTDTGTPVIHADPLLNAATYVITNRASPAVNSGVAVAGYDTDFFGAPRNPTNPCLGAIEFDGGGAPIIPGGVTISTARIVRDGGGRIIRRIHGGCVQNFAHDGRGRLTACDWGGSLSNATTYTYDHAGRRVLITETLAGRTTVTRCVYDGADVCTDFVDSNNDGAVDRTRVYWLLPGMDRRIGFADITNGVATFYYYITDQVGSVLQIVNDAGTVVNQYDYDAWGNVRWGGSNTFEHVENRYLFQGREWDRNGGFYYFRNRIYLPERGEFASPDRNLGRGILGEMDGMGTLVFCGGDPVNKTDPTGLFEATEDEKGRTIRADDPDFLRRENMREWDERRSKEVEAALNSFTRKSTSVSVGFFPVAGSLQSVTEFISGRDYITGERASRGWAAVGVVAGVAPGGKPAVRVIARGVEKILGRVGGIEKTLSVVSKETQLLTKAENGLSEFRSLVSAENIVSIDQLNASHFSSGYGEAVFYAGRGKLNRLAANASGGTTIGSTAGGQALDRIVDWSSMSMQESRAFAAPYSEMFAEQASGPIRSWAGGASLESVWRQTELPALLRNPKVTKITILDAARPEITRIIYPKR